MTILKIGKSTKLRIMSHFSFKYHNNVTRPLCQDFFEKIQKVYVKF